jgi:hypothetical protein
MNILFINASRHKLCVFLRKNIGWCNLNIDSAIPSMSAQIHNPTKTCKLCQHCYCQLGFSDILGFGNGAKIGMPFVWHRSLARKKKIPYIVMPIKLTLTTQD